MEREWHESGSGRVDRTGVPCPPVLTVPQPVTRECVFKLRYEEERRNLNTNSLERVRGCEMSNDV